MASLTETLAANNEGPVQNVDIAGNISKGLQAGIGLATAAEQVKAKKMEVESQKIDLITKQASTANSLLTNLARANPMIAKRMLPQVKEKLLNLGVDPTVADYTVSDDANRKRQIAFSNMAAGKIPTDPKLASEYFQYLADVVGFDQAAQEFDKALKMQMEDKKLTQQNQQFYANLENQQKVAAIEAGKAERKEDAVLAKEQRKEAKQITEDLFKVEGTIDNIKQAQKKLDEYSRKSVGGTGPLATGFGLKSYVDQDTEGLEADFNKLSMKSMVDMFAGMSKAIDTGAERKAFESTQAGIKLDDKTNKTILADQLKAAERLKQKLLAAKEKFGGDSQSTTSSPTAQQQTASISPDLEAKRQAAIKAGYSPAEVDAYVQKLMNARK